MTVNGYISAIIVGLLIGVLGRLVLPGRQRVGVFVTLLVGVGAALLGTFVAKAFGVDDNAPAKVGDVSWDWVELGIQVTFSVIGMGIANALTHTVLAHTDAPRRRTRRRKKS